MHGYILEVDLEFSDTLRELHNDYPLVPENLKLIVIYCQNVVEIFQISVPIKFGGINRLVSNLGDKDK